MRLFMGKWTCCLEIKWIWTDSTMVLFISPLFFRFCSGDPERESLSEEIWCLESGVLTFCFHPPAENTGFTVLCQLTTIDSKGLEKHLTWGVCVWLQFMTPQRTNFQNCVLRNTIRSKKKNVLYLDCLFLFPWSWQYNHKRKTSVSGQTAQSLCAQNDVSVTFQLKRCELPKVILL